MLVPPPPLSIESVSPSVPLFVKSVSPPPPLTKDLVCQSGEGTENQWGGADNLGGDGNNEGWTHRARGRDGQPDGTDKGAIDKIGG